ncbi:hypothetical protein [Streptomyces sp. NPDC046727]|uniref:hypothetical protein n=1 Tax=Streptomyces sp. NPDC046727 TaxID=3155373 RepID=UPI003409BA0F
MAIYDLIRGGADAALILACTMAGTYVLLVFIVLIKPSSTRGKAAKELLQSHPFSKRPDPSEGNGQDANHNTS